MHRRLAEGRKTAQGALANRILGIGDVFQVEKVSYRAFQRAFGRSVGRRAPGMFVERLSRKAESAGGTVIAFPTETTALSQVCQCGRRAKKPLSLRWHQCLCGVSAQRDLYSAYLARFVHQTEDKTYLTATSDKKYYVNQGASGAGSAVHRDAIQVARRLTVISASSARTEWRDAPRDDSPNRLVRQASRVDTAQAAGGGPTPRRTPTPQARIRV